LGIHLKPVNERKFPLDTAGFPEFRQTVHFIGFQVCFLFDFLGEGRDRWVFFCVDLFFLSLEMTIN